MIARRKIVSITLGISTPVTVPPEIRSRSSIRISLPINFVIVIIKIANSSVGFRYGKRKIMIC